MILMMKIIIILAINLMRGKMTRNTCRCEAKRVFRAIFPKNDMSLHSVHWQLPLEIKIVMLESLISHCQSRPQWPLQSSPAPCHRQIFAFCLCRTLALLLAVAFQDFHLAARYQDCNCDLLGTHKRKDSNYSIIETKGQMPCLHDLSLNWYKSELRDNCGRVNQRAMVSKLRWKY